jgi:DNA topoisomerase-1
VSGKNVYTKIGRYGPLVQIGESREDEKPKFAGMKKGQSIETVTLEEALDMFKLPREIGTYEGEVMTAAIGRFGPYVRHKNQFFSLAKTDDPLSITEERAIELINNKRQADKERIIKEFAEDKSIQILKGRYGAYISQGKKNYRIPKGKDPAELSLEDCQEIISASDNRQTGKKRK